MEGNFIISAIFILLASLGIAFWYYRKQDLGMLEGITKPVFYLLMVLRTFGLFFIGILLLGYVFKSEVKEKDPPVVVWLQDNSMSIVLNKDSSFYQNDYPNKARSEMDEISTQFQLDVFGFNGGLSEDNVFEFDGKTTDIQSALDQVYNKFYGKNIGAVILASDGVYNEGLSPVFSSKIADLVPIIAIGLGDTSQQRDLFIADVSHNNISFLGNDFMVEADIKAFEVENGSYEVKLSHNGNTIDTKKIDIDSVMHYKNINWTLPANNIGVQKYTIELSPLEDEITYLNNKKSFYIDVVDSRQKVLLLGKAPHPDLGAVKAALLKNKNYEVEVQYLTSNLKLNQDFSLIVLHNLPSEGTPLPNGVLKNKIPKIFLVGAATDLQQLSSLNIGFTSGASRGSENVQSKVNPDFDNFKMDGDWKKAIENYPPLFSPYANYKFSEAAKVLSYQSVAGVKKELPTMVYLNNAGNKSTFIMGEGIWRWRLNEGKTANGELIFDQLIEKMVQITSSKEDKSRLRIDVRQEWNEQESVVFKGEFYNEAFELMNGPELKLELKNEADGTTFDYSFLKQQDRYKLDLGALPPGDYQWEAKLQHNGQLFSKKGIIVVKKLDREGLVTKADHQLLRDLAARSNGAFMTVSEMDGLADLVLNRGDIQTVVYTTEKSSDLIDWKWLFLIIALCFTAEWFLRKFNGAL